MVVQIYFNCAQKMISKKNSITSQQVCIKNDLNINIVLFSGEEELKKIIKIQSNIRGMEMRDKIKLKSKNKRLIQPKQSNEKVDVLNSENNIIKETDENEKEKYEKIIVNKKYIFIIIKYSLKLI